MPLVPAKCTVCGSVLTIDSNKKAAVCQSCGNAFVVEDAINNYNTYNNIVNNITADTVVVNAESEKEQLYRNAETFRKLGKYEKAKSYYNSMVKDYSDDWRGWWGMILCDTEDFTVLSKEEQTVYLFDVVQKLVPIERKEQLQAQYKGYLQTAAECDAERDLENAQKLLADEAVDNDPKIVALSSQIKNLELEYQEQIKDQEAIVAEKEKVCRDANEKIERCNKLIQRSQTLFYTGVVSLIIGLLILFLWAPANLKSYMDGGGNPMFFTVLSTLLILWGAFCAFFIPSINKSYLAGIEHQKEVLSSNRKLLIEAQAKVNQLRQNLAEKKATVEQEKQMYSEHKSAQYAERTMLCNEYIGFGKQRLVSYHFAVKCKRVNIPAENDEAVELLRNKLFIN